MTFTSKGIAGILMFLAVSTNTLFAQTEQNQAQQTQTQQVEVTDAELEKFAQAFQRIRVLNQEAQVQMTELVQEEGLDIQRFNEIHQAKMDPEAEVETTEQEEKQYENISSEIGEMQTSFQGRMEKLITDQDISIQKYQQIAAQIQNDPELQERLRAVFQQ